MPCVAKIAMTPPIKLQSLRFPKSKELTSPNVESSKNDLLLRNLTRELLELYILRYRIARIGGMPVRFEEIHDHLQKAVQTAKSRFSNGEAGLWSYFEAKDLHLAADIQQRAGSY